MGPFKLTWLLCRIVATSRRFFFSLIVESGNRGVTEVEFTCFIKFPPAFLKGRKPFPQEVMEDKCHKHTEFRLCGSYNSENASFHLGNSVWGGGRV